ncbi:hypothetical protein LNT18_25180 [Klebsiella pneumoniae]|nr:hypothetical protein [Klebsiella pneumoniae]
MMSLWDALRMNMMISYQELVRTFLSTIELTEILLDGLLRKFERLALGEYGNVEGVKALKGIYSNSVDVNGSGEFLTESGKELIDELISELVEFVKKQKPVTAESGNE